MLVELSPLSVAGRGEPAKIAVQANALMAAELTPDQVERESVAAVTADRIAAAGSRGRRVKMVCEAFRDGGTVRGRVRTREVRRDDPLALVEGTGSLIRFVTDILGTFTVAEERPDLATTAYGVIAGLFAVRLSRA